MINDQRCQHRREAGYGAHVIDVRARAPKQPADPHPPSPACCFHQLASCPYTHSTHSYVSNTASRQRWQNELIRKLAQVENPAWSNMGRSLASVYDQPLPLEVAPEASTSGPTLEQIFEARKLGWRHALDEPLDSDAVFEAFLPLQEGCGSHPAEQEEAAVIAPVVAEESRHCPPEPETGLDAEAPLSPSSGESSLYSART